jgi:hypothetical protein
MSGKTTLCVSLSRSYDIHEGTLTDQGAPADHSATLARRTGCNQSVQLKSVGRAPANMGELVGK